MCIKRGHVMWWDNPDQFIDGFRSCMVQVTEVREKGLLDTNEDFVSVKQLYNDVVIEVHEEELHRRMLGEHKKNVWVPSCEDY